MKKQTFKNYLKIGILLFGIALLFTNCETESVSAIEMSQTNHVQDAKSWFENNPKNNNYSLLNFTETIDWTLAKVSYQDNKVAVEVPLILKQNFNLFAAKSNVSLQSVNRLVFIKKKQSDFSSFIINIKALDNNIQLVNDLNKINYFNISEDFSGKILIISNNDKSTVLNLIVNGKLKIKPDNLFSKEPSVSCYEVVEVFSDGSIRRTGISYCIDDSGPYNPYSNTPSYPNHGGGGGGGVDDDKIDASGLTGKADCVYNKMVDGNNNINWILQNFKDGTNPSEFDLVFEMSTDLPNNVNGQTSNLMNNTITIKINANTLSGRTNLEVARTILHEGIHARLKEFMYRNEGSTTANFPGIYDFFRFKNNWGHQQMASYYRSTIAKGLKQFDNGQHLDSYYNALAWVGLNKNLTDHNNQGATYNTLAWDSLSIPEQTTILNTIQDEKENGNKNCN